MSTYAVAILVLEFFFFFNLLHRFLWILVLCWNFLGSLYLFEASDMVVLQFILLILISGDIINTFLLSAISLLSFIFLYCLIIIYYQAKIIYIIYVESTKSGCAAVSVATLFVLFYFYIHPPRSYPNME